MIDMGVSIVMGVLHGAPKWMGFVREHPKLKWMMTGGTPISGNLYMVVYLC